LEDEINTLRDNIKSNKQALGGVNAGAENQNTLVKQVNNAFLEMIAQDQNLGE
jgi:hypothetical protein